MLAIRGRNRLEEYFPSTRIILWTSALRLIEYENPKKNNGMPKLDFIKLINISFLTDSSSISHSKEYFIR